MSKFIAVFLALLSVSNSTVVIADSDTDFVNTSTECLQQAQYDVIIRVGEYPNKPGKRVYLKESEVYLVNNLPVHRDDKGLYICEYDINLQLASKVVRNLEDKGVNVRLLTSTSKKEDLNSAGRKAMSYNPKVYFSIHHNFYAEDSSGYFLMVNKNSTQESLMAKDISKAISKVSSIKPLENRVQNGYIGEMNETDSTLNFLYEGGFFSNKKELYVITSKQHTDKVANVIANELYQILRGDN